MFRTGSSTLSTDCRRRAWRPAFAGAAVLAAVSLAGCGFQPIHAQRSQASADALSQVEIALIPDRKGQMLRNELLQRFRPRGIVAPTRFVLNVNLNESYQDLAIRKDEVATRANLTLRAAFTVRAAEDKEPLFSGRASSVNSYNILTSDFSTLAARADARKRAVRRLADDIKERVSVWLVQTGGIAPQRQGDAESG